jgi:hypothetical protein
VVVITQAGCTERYACRLDGTTFVRQRRRVLLSHGSLSWDAKNAWFSSLGRLFYFTSSAGEGSDFPSAFGPFRPGRVCGMCRCGVAVHAVAKTLHRFLPPREDDPPLWPISWDFATCPRHTRSS